MLEIVGFIPGDGASIFKQTHLCRKIDRYTANKRKEGALWLPINIHIGKKKKNKTTKTLIVTILCPGTIFFQKSSQKSFFIPQVSDTNI